MNRTSKMAAMLLLAFATLNFFTSCEKNSQKSDLKSAVQSITEPEINETGNIADTVVSDKKQVKHEQGPPGQNPVVNPDWDKKIIKNASINLEVKDYKVYYTSLREKVRSFGGYIAQEEQTQSEYNIQNNLSIKVPVDQFDNAVFQLTQNVEKLNEKKITSQDVTTEFVDTKSRMESKKQVRQKYLDLLKQAKNMEEILSVQSEINGIQEEIESAAGRIEYLSHSSTFSTINLTYYQVLNPSAKIDENPNFGTKLGIAFRNGGNWVVDLFVGLVSIWPLLLAVFAGIILYRKTRKPGIKPAA